MIENPYQPPLETDSESDNTTDTAMQSFRASAMLGMRVAVKWVTIIIAPILVLAFLFTLGFMVYSGFKDNDWSGFFESEKRWHLIQLCIALVGAYIVCCFWASLFGIVVYMTRHMSSTSAHQNGSAAVKNSDAENPGR